MFISDDIRTGARLTKPIKRKYIHYVYGKTMMTCALGAACIAVGRKDLAKGQTDSGITDHWPELKEIVTWPEEILTEYIRQHGVHPRRTLFSTIIHLNDHCDWTREAIADWIDTLDLPRPLEIPQRTLELQQKYDAISAEMAETNGQGYD